MPEIVVVLTVFPATLGAAYFAQRGLLSLLFRTMSGPGGIQNRPEPGA